MKLNTIYNEDCLKTMKRMQDCFVDMIITSPPYDDLRNYQGYNFNFKKIANELYRILKSGSILVWVVGDATINGSETGTSFKQALYFKQIGFNLHDTMIWNKTNPMPQIQHNRYSQTFEYMFILSKGKIKTFNPILINSKNSGQHYSYTAKHPKENSQRIKKDFYINNKKRLYNLWNMAVDKTKIKHPAKFPVQLAKRHILSWSNENDIIYDCFIGSGTSAVASLILNRKFIGSEVSKEYTETANKRLIKYISQKNLFYD